MTGVQTCALPIFASAMAASKMAECALNLLDTDCFGMLNYCDEGAELLSNCNGEE